MVLDTARADVPAQADGQLWIGLLFAIGAMLSWLAFAWSGDWPPTLQVLACVLFVIGILSSTRAHR